MKALLAIVITVGLLTACYVISALVYLDLTVVLVGLSSIWAAWDSNRIGLYRYKLGFSGKPLVVFSLSYLFWIVLFPYYLWLRFKVKQGAAALKDQESPSKTLSRRFLKVRERLAGWGIIATAGLKIGLLIFCLEECWRGQRMWENYRHEFEEKGQSLNWDTMIPPPVPDSQNFYSAPMMSVWFVQPSGKVRITDDIWQRLKYSSSSPEMEIAEITRVSPGSGPRAETAPNLFRFDDPKSSGRVKKLIQNALGPYAFGAQGLTLLARPLNTNQLRPPQIYLETDQKLNGKDLNSFFFGQFASHAQLSFVPKGTNSWLVLARFCPAKDYLRWSEQFNGDFNLMREAVKRPDARIDGDYSYPPSMPLPNFKNFSIVWQTLSLRAQCFMLLDQPDNALEELSLLNDLRSKLEGAPTGKPMSLASAMMNVAVAKLYVETVQDGFRLQVWKEPQLAKLEEQLARINLAPSVKESFHEEEASVVRIVEVLMRNLEFQRVPNASLLQNIKNLVPPNLARGFFYFDEMSAVSLHQMLADSIDPSSETV